jgi:hypothetical protein
MTRTGGSFHFGAASTGKPLPCKLLIKPGQRLRPNSLPVVF